MQVTTELRPLFSYSILYIIFTIVLIFFSLILNKYMKKKELRKKLGLTQQEIAKECSISQTTYSTYESGIYLISTITIYTICTKYNISIDWIVGLKNDDYKLKMS